DWSSDVCSSDLLTSIIPIRSTEFCLIKRDSTSKENNKFFVTITSIKKPLNDSVNYYNKIEINESMYHLLINYIELTEEYGESETLISYRSLIYADTSGCRALHTRYIDASNKTNLYKLL